MLRNWIYTFIYQVKHNKLFTLLNVSGLSVGVAGLIFSGLYLNDEQSYNAWNPEKGKVYEVISHIPGGDTWHSSVSGVGRALKNKGFDSIQYCYFVFWTPDILVEYEGEKKLVGKLFHTQRNFFSFFPFSFLKGSAKAMLRDKNSIAISEKTARLLFGDENPIGKKVVFINKQRSFFYDGVKKEPHIVKGVYKIPGKSSIAPNIVEVGLIENRLKRDYNNWGNFNFSLLLKINDPSKKQAIIKAINQLYYENNTAKFAKAKGLSVEDYAKQYGTITVSLERLKDARLHSKVNGYPEGRGNYRFLMITLGLSVLILLLSVINYVNMATANAIKRAKEVGIRKSMGATKKNIVTQLLFETIFITLFSILLALVIVELSLPYYNDFLNKNLTFDQNGFYLQLFIVFFVVVISAGIFPAVYVAGFNPLKVLKGNFSRSKKGIWLRNAMLVFQFAIASFFIIGAYVAREQVSYMSRMDLGFKGDQILEISGFPISTDVDSEDNSNYNRYLTTKQEIEKIKGVKAVTAGALRFGREGMSSTSGFSYKGNAVQAFNEAIDFNTLDIFNIKLKKGRVLSAKFASDTIRSVLINETTARLMKEPDPVGKRFDWNDRKFTIVGVVKNFHLSGGQNKIPPMVFFHFKTVARLQSSLNHIFVKISPETAQETLSAIEKFWTTHIGSDYPFDYDFVNKAFARSYQSFVKQKNMFALLNLVVILIASFGLFALASYSIERRMKEIAVRKTLGAQTKTLLKNLSKQYVVFSVIGFLIALFPTYYLLSRWLENFAYRIEISFLPFLAGFIFLMLLTLFVVLLRAYRATRLDVLKYLKYE